MSYRYTIKDARKSFVRLCELLGKREATSWHDVGGWRLDNYPMYGGVNVEEIVNEQGGITHPIGSTRHNPREFVMAVEFLSMSLEARAVNCPNCGYYSPSAVKLARKQLAGSIDAPECPKCYAVLETASDGWTIKARLR